MSAKPNPLKVIDGLIQDVKTVCADPKCDVCVNHDEARAAVAELIEEHANLARRVEGLERLRPVWAQGWTDDSMAAQASAAALSQIWRALGVTNQTDAMAALAAFEVTP